MNRIEFYRLPDGTFSGFRARGHSGYAESGQDIVCAAVSALTQTIANGIEAVAKIPANVHINEKKAALEVTITPEATENQLKQAQLLFETLHQGLQAIEDEYPRNVSISYEERRL